jgi:glycosyltransferase involved in cell wall biosynthesis
MPHIGFDLLFLAPGESGGRETYARELLRELVATGTRVTAFVNGQTAARDGFHGLADRVVVLPRADPHSRARWALGELAALPRAAARAGVDVLHSPANFGPWGGRFARVLTVHDMLWRRLPGPRAVSLATDALVLPAARRADRLITVSEASRADVSAALGVPGGRISVVPNGVVPPSGAGDAARARVRWGLGERPVALCVATALPHKNLPALIDAVATIPPPRPLLVLAGHGTDVLPPSGDVRALGAVSSAELEDLYAAAGALVTATRYEGFGLPVLEAMARGVPVACSDLPVLREVAADAALFVDPDDPGTIAAAVNRLLAGGPQVEALRTAGRERAARFSWRAAAEATLAVYREAASTRR